MPATFNGHGLHFLYPDNWSIVEPSDEAPESGVALELPTGGFFSIELAQDHQTDQQIITEIRETIEEEYGDTEVDELPADEGDRRIDLQFYFLDLLVIFRLMLLERSGRRLIVQIQAESRDFEANEPVFDAIVKQLS